MFVHMLTFLANCLMVGCKMLKEVLSSSSTGQINPDFGSTRESILQVFEMLYFT